MINNQLFRFGSLVMASLGMFTTIALAHEKGEDADSSFCGDGTYDKAIGQYVGSHDTGTNPPVVQGTNPNDLTIEFGGIGRIDEVAGIGASAAWGTNGDPQGDLNTGLHLMWRNVGHNTYNIAVEVLTGSASALPGTPFGVFPTSNFQRAYAKGTAVLSKDCKQLNMSFSVCITDVLNLNYVHDTTPCDPVAESVGVINLIYRKLPLP